MKLAGGRDNESMFPGYHTARRNPPDTGGPIPQHIVLTALKLTTPQGVWEERRFFPLLNI